MPRPTENAERNFSLADQSARNAMNFLNQSPLTEFNRKNGEFSQAYAISRLAAGLGEMSVGLRATYILLEEVKMLLQRQGR